MWSAVMVCDGLTENRPALGGVSLLPSNHLMDLTELLPQLDHEHVVVLAHESVAVQVGTAVTVAQGRYPDRPLALVTSSQAPLALLAAAASALTACHEAVLAVQMVRDLLHQSWSAAWMSSVARLPSPSASLWQHAVSWLPNTSFVARHHPNPGVDSVRATGFGAAMSVPVPRELLVQDGQEGRLPQDLLQRLSAEIRPTAVRQLQLPGTWSTLYGARGAVQLAAVPSDLRVFRPTPSGACRQCRLPAASPVCPFCRTTVDRPTVEPASTSPVPSGAHQ